MDDPALLVWLERLMTFSALLVALGVTGEFVGNWIASPIRNRINAAKDAEISRFNKDAGEARKAAGEAIERAAVLELETLKLQKELMVQASRTSLFVGENRQEFVDALKPFSGQKIDIRRSATAIMVNGAVVASTPVGDDTVGLANALFKALTDAGWKLPPNPLLSNLQGYGLEVEILHNAPHGTQKAAKALVDALKHLSLSVNGPALVNEDRAQRVGNAVILPALDENTVILHILTHP
jgi:hypothetical protein